MAWIFFFNFTFYFKHFKGNKSDELARRRAGGRRDGDSHVLEELLDVGARADLLRERVEDVEGEILRLDLVVLREDGGKKKTPNS